MDVFIYIFILLFLPPHVSCCHYCLVLLCTCHWMLNKFDREGAEKFPLLLFKISTTSKTSSVSLFSLMCVCMYATASMLVCLSG